MTNLLTDAVIRTYLSDTTTASLSLPEVYAAMATDDVIAFPALRPYQRHAWHAFLAQLGVIATHQAGNEDFPTTADAWRELIRNLTTDYPDDEPWCLIVEDSSQPAFMQCPAPKGLGDYKGHTETPDDLDILVTSKNHDVKRTIAVDAAAEDWVFSLISLQTMAPFLGQGNYGIARMNGGFSSRPCLGLAPQEGGLGAHLYFDMRRMIANRDDLLEQYESYYKPIDGCALLWLEPWSGESSADLSTLDPYFIEICRRVRLQTAHGTIFALTAPSKKGRIDAKQAQGDLGDFWTPVKKDDGKALSLAQGGFTYKKLVDLLSPDFKQPDALRVGRGSDQEWRLIARSISGGQGKTDGYHERSDVFLAGKTASAFSNEDDLKALGEIAQKQMNEVSEVAKALGNAIRVAASGGKNLSDITNKYYDTSRGFVKKFDTYAEDRFFEFLNRRFIKQDDRIRVDFVRGLIHDARTILDEAIGSIPYQSIHRHRARVKAESTFWGMLRSPKGLFSDQPEIFTREEEINDH